MSPIGMGGGMEGLQKSVLEEITYLESIKDKTADQIKRLEDLKKEKQGPAEAFLGTKNDTEKGIS